MRKLLSKISIAAVLATGFHFAAHASVMDLGVISGTETLSNTTQPGQFTDFYKFSVPVSNAAAIATTSILYEATYGTLVQSLNLYRGSFDTAASLPAIPISLPFITTIAESNGWLITTLASSAILDAAAYTLVIGGTGTGQAAYTGIISLTETPRTLPPVPEPETYAMLLAGLGMLGFIARRRQKNM